MHNTTNTSKIFYFHLYNIIYIIANKIYFVYKITKYFENFYNLNTIYSLSSGSNYSIKTNSVLSKGI